MAFLETPRFPLTMTYGTSGGPVFNTDVVTYANGREYRNANWEFQLNTYDLRYNVRDRQQLMEVYNFFISRQGMFEGFRLKDMLDYTTGASGVSTPTATDVFIGTTDGVNSSYQLRKAYSADNLTQITYKPILKPVDGTVLASLDGTPVTNFTIDYTTGIITFDSPPVAGLAVRAGCEFDIPVRFDTDDFSGIELILLRSSNRELDRLGLPNIPVKEIRN